MKWKKPTKIVWHYGTRGKIHFIHKLRCDGKEIAGRCEAEVDGNPDVKINSNRTDNYQARILFHEMLHKALRPVLQGDSDENIEETIVYTIEKHMCNVMASNKEAFHWLIEALD